MTSDDPVQRALRAMRESGHCITETVVDAAPVNAQTVTSVPARQAQVPIARPRSLDMFNPMSVELGTPYSDRVSYYAIELSLPRGAWLFLPVTMQCFTFEGVYVDQNTYIPFGPWPMTKVPPGPFFIDRPIAISVALAIRDEGGYLGNAALFDCVLAEPL